MTALDNRAFFGRRKGHRLRRRHAELVAGLLPGLRIQTDIAPIDPRALFGSRIDALGLEIGFGSGEHLASRAAENPRIGWIGCEPFINGAAKLLAAIDAGSLRNIRIFDADAAGLLPRLPVASIDRIFLLFPDPWPKRRHRKRRFISQATLAELARVTRPGGVLHFASDIDDYIGWTLARLMGSLDWRWAAQRPADWRRPWSDWSGTRYEAKALREGRVPSYLTFERTELAADSRF